jgi:hypothetical protein
MLTHAIIRVDQQQLQTILMALDELPGKVTRVVHNAICSQVEQQMNAHAAAEKALLEQAAQKKPDNVVPIQKDAAD